MKQQKSKYQIISVVVLALFIFSCTPSTTKIDRYALVTRHNIVHSQTDSLSPLTVGNGEFAFTVDITGMQTFHEHYGNGMPLGTFANWSWHSFPNTENYTLEDVTKYSQVGNKKVPYWPEFKRNCEQRKIDATKWLRESPQKYHLGLIGLQLTSSDSTIVNISDLENPEQTLNLWTGEIVSKFEFEGTPVTVHTFCDQESDAVSISVESPLIEENRLSVNYTFVYPSHEKFSKGYHLDMPDAHTTKIENQDENTALIFRQMDTTVYYASLQWEGEGKLTQTGTHEFNLSANEGNSITFSCLFTDNQPEQSAASFAAVQENNKNEWENFWESGAAIDFSECTDERAFELERRLVLSQYLTKIQSTGTLPPAETGLTYNSWHGKFHMEMIWWHAMHFIYWNRTDLIREQLEYYFNIYDRAKQTAETQGYEGVRWPKMTDPEGRDSPSSIGTYLIWQQPHIIYFAELMYQTETDQEAILQKYGKLISETADFMASYARWDSTTNRYVLGPALIPAQERFKAATTINPVFELAYWYWGLNAAQEWRKRQGMEPSEKYQHVIDHLSRIPTLDSVFLFTEDATDSYTYPEYLTDHPIVLGAVGFIPPTGYVNMDTMLLTQQKVKEVWDWESIWGWDIPLAAMNAVFLDKPEEAVDFLMMDTPKNTYMVNGHNYQRKGLSLYLPGNGGILSAAALMCTYRNSEGKNGFPDNGKWNVKYENMNPWLKADFTE